MKHRPEYDTDGFKKGLEIRKAVLGEKAVERSLSAATDFSAPLQQIVTEYCWGRSGLGLAWTGRHGAYSISRC